MRWPFGPPHLTLKPLQKQKETTKTKNKKTNKKQKVKKHKNTKKKTFQLSVKISFFWGGCPKIAFFDNLAQKARTPKTL